VMSFLSSQNITVISLILSVVSAALVIVLSVFVWKQSESRRLARDDIDASALVQEFGERQKRLEQKLIDVKVRFEILELRLAKDGMPAVLKAQPRTIQGSAKARRAGVFGDSSKVSSHYSMEEDDRELPRTTTTTSISPVVLDSGLGVESEEEPGGAQEPKVNGTALDATALEVLRILKETSGRSARDIQMRIRRSREHTSRLMNWLYKEGLVSRDDNARPFVYSLTSAGQNELAGSKGQT
jgi:DNA-binding transcriptional ArsR family regulator